MQINKFFKDSLFISKEYKFFAFLITILILFAYVIFIGISYQNHRNTYNQKYLSLGFVAANNYEFFLDNIFRQAEFIGHKIDETDKKNSIDKLLKHNFSLDIKLETSLLGSWTKFEWIDANNPKINDYDLSASKREPWLLHFGSLHINSADSKDYFIPIAFGITNDSGKFTGSLTGNINISAVINFLHHNLQENSLSILILDIDKRVIGQSKNSTIDLPKDFFKNENFSYNKGNIYRKFDLANTAYVAYKKLDNYPFIVIVGDNKDTIFRPLKNTLLKYFVILTIVLIALLIILLVFYKKIITPLVSLSSFAKDIISPKKDIEFVPKQHSFIEISNLEQALIKINSYKKEINTINSELENNKKRLEQDLKKLSDSYKLRDNLLN
jgi:hypothetical protein